MSTTTTAFEMDGLKTRLKETSKRTCTQRCVPSRRPLAELLPICRLLGRQSVKGRVSSEVFTRSQTSMITSRWFRSDAFRRTSSSD
jgi:hypothetical protein